MTMTIEAVRLAADAAAIGGFAALLGWAAWRDGRAFVIPNPVCLAIAALYPLHAAAAPAGPAWPQALALAAAVFAVGVACFSRGWLGGGDVKLAAAVALWAGPQFAPDFLLIAALTGAGLGLVMLAAAHLRAQATGEAAGVLARSQPVPYGLAIATGGLWTALRLWPL